MKKSASDLNTNTIKPMSCTEFTNLCIGLFGSVYAARKPLNMSYSQLNRISRGESPVHPALCRLLRIMKAHNLHAHDLL